MVPPGSRSPAPISVSSSAASAAGQTTGKTQPSALSTSPHSNISEMEADNEQLDEVFSNPDTADLGYRSDGTGATSPGPNSPGPSSPLARSVLGSAMAAKAAHASSHEDTPVPTMAPAPALRLESLPGFPKSTPSNHTIRPVEVTGTEPAVVTQAPHPVQTLSPSGPGSLASSPQTPLSPGASSARKDATSVSQRRLSAHVFASTVGSSPSLGTLPAANDLPTDPVEASTVSRLFAHPPAASPATAPASVASPPRTPGLSPRSATTSGQPLGSPTIERSGPLFKASRGTIRAASPDARSKGDACTLTPPQVLIGPPRTGALADRPTSASSAVSGFSTLGSPSLMGPAAGATLAAASGRSQSIFERDIEHRDASHIMSKQEAIDVAIPSVLDDAVEAIIEDGTEQIEVVAPQMSAPPLALSSVALSVHSGANSPALAAVPPSPPRTSTAQFEAPPGSMAAQIAERLGPRPSAPSTDDAKSLAAGPRGSKLASHRRPGSDASSVATSLRSRSPQAGSKAIREVLDASPVRSRAPASPAPGPHASLAAAVSQASRAPSATASSPVCAAAPSQTGSSILAAPTATAYPSLPLPNPYRSSSPNLAALSLPMTASMSDLGRPATSSLSIDGAVISGADVASIDHSLDNLADVIAASDAEESASPYVSRSPAMFNYASGTSSPTMDKSKARKAKGSGDGRIGPLTGFGTVPGGLGVFDAGEGSSLAALSSGAPSPSQEKRRLSFFAYADILNQNRGEVMDFEGVVRQAAERDDQQHGHAVGYAKHATDLSQSLFSSSSIMSRSVSTGAADHRRSGPGARLSSISGANTPLRGRREELENQALSNRLESLSLASGSAARPRQ